MVTKKVSNINDELDIKLFVFIAKRSLLYVFAFIFVGWLLLLFTSGIRILFIRHRLLFR